MYIFGTYLKGNSAEFLYQMYFAFVRISKVETHDLPVEE